VKKVKEEDEEEEATAENFDTSELLSKQKELLKSMDSLKPLLKSLSDKKVDGFATMDSLPKFADFK
jgi:hypothetical protein